MATSSDTDRDLRKKLSRGQPNAGHTPTIVRIGKYQVRRKLGSGGMGDVFLATDPDLGREVAIKVINLPLTSPDARRTFIERFRVEARAAARVTHPNVVTIYEFSEVESKHLLVMEYIRGRTLKELTAGGTALPPEQVARLAIDILDGLTAIHAAGMIHRDVKPMNLMLTSAGRVKILDFGLVKDTLQSNDLTQMGFVAGSPSYMAPEQAGLGLGAIDARSDLYALGVVLFQLLTGRLPFIGNNAIEILQQHSRAPVPAIVSPHGPVPPGMIEIVRKAMSKRPQERYATASEMRSVLMRFLGSAQPTVSGLSGTLPAHVSGSLALTRTVTPSGIGRPAQADRKLVPVTAQASPPRNRVPSRPPPLPAAALRSRKLSAPVPGPIEAPALAAKAATASWTLTLLVFASVMACAVLAWMHVTGRAPWNAPAATGGRDAKTSATAASAPDASVPNAAPAAVDGCKAYEEMRLSLAIEILKPLDLETLDAKQLFCLCASEHALGHADEQKDCRRFLNHPERDRSKARQVKLWISDPGAR